MRCRLGRSAGEGGTQGEGQALLCAPLRWWQNIIPDFRTDLRISIASLVLHDTAAWTVRRREMVGRGETGRMLLFYFLVCLFCFVFVYGFIVLFMYRVCISLSSVCLARVLSLGK